MQSRPEQEAHVDVPIGTEEDSSLGGLYTAVLLRDPRSFCSEYSLEGYEKVKLLVVITMYNEHQEELVLTLRGVCDNIRALILRTQNPLAWEQVAVVIVSDGRVKASADTLELMSSLGLYDEKEIEATLDRHDPNQVGVHLFENTAVFSDNPDLGTEFPPLQMIFALKEHNAGKLDSHWWFFCAFAQAINPEYCFLLDVGTKPRRKAFYHIYRAFDRNPHISGACGEIATRNIANFSPVVAAQHFEYKISNILAKPLESVCGYITVLPGAFSAYRWKALQGQPLRKYFQFIESQAAGKAIEMTPFEADMFLAEDRILCFELFAKDNSNWSLHYVKDSVAETDVPTGLIDLLKQRRRWINGSFFAMLYSLIGFWRVLLSSSHPIERKIISTFQFIYMVLQLLFSWFLPGSFFLTLYYALNYATSYSIYARVAFPIVFVSIIAFTLYASLRCKPGDYPAFYILSSLLLGVIFVGATVLTVYYVVNVVIDNSDWVLAAAAGSLILIYLAVGIVYGELAPLLLSFSQYWFMIPTFSIVFPIFANANIHDVSWGTKNIEASKADEKASSLRFFRNCLLAFWIACNVALSVFFPLFDNENASELFLYILFFAALGINLVQFLGSMLYVLVRSFTRTDEGRAERLERLRIREMLKQDDLMPQSDWYSSLPAFWKFWAVYFRPITWTNIFMSAFSVVYGLGTLIWCAASLVVSLPALFIFPIGTALSSVLASSWQYLGLVEFDVQSRDGRFAAMLGVDSGTLGAESKGYPKLTSSEGCMSSFEKFFLWQRQILLDPYTRTCVVFFLIIKPIIVVTGIALIGTSVLGTLVLLQPMFAVECSRDTNFGGRLCEWFLDVSEADWFGAQVVASGFFGFFTVPFGLALVAITLLLVNKFASFSRKVTSSYLGEELLEFHLIRPIELKNRHKDSGHEEERAAELTDHRVRPEDEDSSDLVRPQEVDEADERVPLKEPKQQFKENVRLAPSISFSIP